MSIVERSGRIPSTLIWTDPPTETIGADDSTRRASEHRRFTLNSPSRSGQGRYDKSRGDPAADL